MGHIGNPDRIKSHIAGMIEDTKNRGDEFLTKFKDSVHRTIEKPVDFIEEISKKEKLSNEDTKSIIDAYLQEAENNLFSVINGFTHAAQKFTTSNPDKRYEFERIAGNLLN